MDKVKNPARDIGNGRILYNCAKCFTDFEADVENDLRAIQEYEEVFNKAFFLDSAESKMVVCDNCYKGIMRVN